MTRSIGASAELSLGIDFVGDSPKMLLNKVVSSSMMTSACPPSTAR